MLLIFSNPPWLPIALSNASCDLSLCNPSELVSMIPASLHFCSQAFLLTLKQKDGDTALSHFHLLFFAWKTFLIHIYMASCLTFLRFLFKCQLVTEVFTDNFRHIHTLTTTSRALSVPFTLIYFSPSHILPSGIF